MKIKCIAVDDEPLALEKIVDYIGQVPFFELVGSFENGLDAMAFLQENDVELIFLDVQMPQILGTQLLQVLKYKPQVIFTTAYSEYAIEGFELDVTDYLLKPIGFRRFLQAAQKALSRRPDPSTSATASPEQVQDYIFVKTETRLQKIKLSEIRYIEGLKDYLSIYTETSRILTLQSFNELLGQLPADFLRIHKSYVVSLAQIDQIEKNRVKIGDKYVPIGETFKKAFLNKVQKGKR